MFWFMLMMMVCCLGGGSGFCIMFMVLCAALMVRWCERLRWCILMGLRYVVVSKLIIRVTSIVVFLGRCSSVYGLV